MPPSTQDPATAASGESRFSRTAIVAAAWMTLFFAVVPAFVWHAAKTHEFENGGPFASPVMVFVFFIFILPAFAAPIATTLLGWISVSQIHHSVGRLYGLGLAVFDGLLFPLIALDYAVVFAERQILLTQFYQPISHLRQIFNQETGATLSIEQFGFLAGLTAILMLDVWVIRSVWRALTQLKVMPTSQAPRPPSPVAARSDTPALARFAAAFCGMAGLLAILAWFGMPHPQQNVVWGILGAAVLAVVFAFPVRQSRLGKRALLGGSTNIAVWFIIFAIFQFFVHSPTAMTGSTDFHCTVFEADAALVDKLIPQTQRSADRATESVQLVVEGNATRSVGPFTVVQAPQALTQAQTAIISQAIVDALMRGVDPIPGVLSDQSREVSTDWWHPGLPDVWSYSKAFKDYSVGGGATILLGYRKSEAADEIHIDCRLNHEENPTAGGSTELSSILYYEGKAPQNGALAFLVPYFREDNSTHYLVVVYQVGQESTPSIAAAEPVDSMPIIERVLEADNPDHRGLNLTSGEFAKSTPGHPLNFGNDGNNTLRDANVDVYFPYEPVEAHYLLSLDMRQCLFSSQPIADLQSITSNQIEQTLAKMKDWRSYMEKPGSPLGAMSTRLRNPTSHIVPDQLCTFTTRDGVDGVLQIVDYTDKPRNIKIRYKLVRSDLNAGHDLQNQEMSSSVQAAEEALAVKESQYKIGVISKYELQHQRDLVEELKAQATGDPVRALQAHLTTALDRQDDAADRFRLGLAPASEYDMAKADADAIAAQLKKAQVYFDQPGTTRPSVQRWETPPATAP